MVKVANKWFAAKKIPNVKFFDVKDADDELEWLVQIGQQGVAEGWKDKLAGAALAGSMAMGGAPAHAGLAGDVIGGLLGHTVISAATDPAKPATIDIDDREFVKQIIDPKDKEKYINALKAAETDVAEKRRLERLKMIIFKKQGMNEQDVAEKMMPTSNFAGSEKNKLGPAGQLKATDSHAKSGDLVGGMEEGKIKGVPIGEHWELEMSKAVLKLFEQALK
jgi:hypothetical protein